jgi:lysyl-tRNA synthetase, class I
MGGMKEERSNYWLDQFADQVVEAYPEGEILVESGSAPSASYHIGHFREVLTADAIAWAIRRRGREARHLHVVDNFDPLRKRYSFLPEEYERYVGWPVCLVPDPEGCHNSYATHFIKQFEASAQHMGVEMEVLYSYESQYLTGKMAPYIEQTIEHMTEVRKIFKGIAHRELKEDWVPLQLLSDNKSFNEWRFVNLDPKAKTVRYRREDGTEGDMPYNDGRVKLNWRLDWPARWALYGVQVEPFGRELGTKGGAWDTGVEFCRQVFGKEPPMPLPYDTINLVGETKKMSSSLGNLVTPDEALELMPPEILRYFVLRSLPKHIVFFDPGLGLYNLIDDFAKLEEEVSAGKRPDFEDAYRVATAIEGERSVARVPFNHMVNVYQTAQGDSERVLELLKRSGYKGAVSSERDVILRELKFVANWLEKHAPASVKFQVQEQLPKVELSDDQGAFLGKLADTIEHESLNAQGMHDAVYAAAQEAGLRPGQAFVAIYRVLLGQDSGPKAGWFLAELDHGWLVGRLREAGNVIPVKTKGSRATALGAKLPDGRELRIDPSVVKDYPDMAVGYLVADVSVEQDGGVVDNIQELVERLGLTRDNLKDQVEISVWRSVYKNFGVKPSDYRSSVEALVRRAIDGKPAKVNSIVDLYNYLSVKHLLPMGAMDLDQIQGDIELRYGNEGEEADLLGVERPVKVLKTQVIYADAQRVITWLWNYRDAKGTAVTASTKRAIFFADSLVGAARAEEAIDELARTLGQLPKCKVLSSGVLSSAAAE